MLFTPKLLVCGGGSYREATMLREVCRDVKVEPALQQIGNTETTSTVKTDKARADVSAVGVWSPMERTFFDVQIFHPNSASYLDKTVEQLYQEKEQGKKRCYNDRILQVEKGSFSPLIYTTTGGMGPESTKVSQKISRADIEQKGRAV